ncbi:MAG TPA: NADH-ubiquinone oxidoreductase-F iron-sulfur binding region domain-containing protein [Steroidobacteraceae bacterium]|nr:NADH-ubiquinone oxidoreductase-F iron-sulfur binding region domain-containing protein [Steroidobacteraceae bacterium]
MNDRDRDVSGTEACVDAAVQRWGSQPTRLVQVLREIQEHYNWLPPAALDRTAQRLALPIARVRGVAAFYDFLATQPTGAFRILFSDDVVDRMHGSADLLRRMCHTLWVEPGKPSEDGLVCIERASFLGFPDQAPSLLVNQRPVTHLDEARIDRLCELILARTPVEQWPAELFEIEQAVHRKGPLLSDPLQPGEGIRAALARVEDGAAGPEAVLDEIKRANLLGRGGAGFTTGLKWDSCRRQAVEPRVVVCNADEGEPGTFKDRLLLSRHADLVFEGMTVAALGIGAALGFVYLRGEYRYLLESLQTVLARRRAGGLLGRTICGRAGFDFDIEVHVGAGSYVCGEASALVESLEGKRGIPRNRPPRLAEKGYLGLPTIVNNVETYCAAALIQRHGAGWFTRHGTEKSSGTKLLSVSGDCERPGIYEYPFGVTVRQVLADCGASRTIAVQCGGPSGRCLEQDEFHRRIAFEDLETGGAFIVFDDGRDMFEVARHFSHFFADESCGFCTPCRVGTSLLARLMDKVSDGRASEHDLHTIEQLTQLLHGACHCGLGESAGKPLADTLQKFRPAYERRLTAYGIEPAFDLDGALARARRMTGRDDPGAHLREPA